MPVHRSVRARRVLGQDAREHEAGRVSRVRGAVHQPGVADSSGGRGPVQPGRHGARRRDRVHHPDRVRHQHVAGVLLRPRAVVAGGLCGLLCVHPDDVRGLRGFGLCRARVLDGGSEGARKVGAGAQAQGVRRKGGQAQRVAGGGGTDHTIITQSLIPTAQSTPTAPSGAHTLPPHGLSRHYHSGSAAARA